VWIVLGRVLCFPVSGGFRRILSVPVLLRQGQERSALPRFHSQHVGFFRRGVDHLVGPLLHFKTDKKKNVRLAHPDDVIRFEFIVVRVRRRRQEHRYRRLVPAHLAGKIVQGEDRGNNGQPRFPDRRGIRPLAGKD